MNEGSGDLVNDLSGNGNDGTLAGGASWESGPLGLVVHANNPNVDSGQYVNLGSKVLDPAGNYTLFFSYKAADPSDVSGFWSNLPSPYDAGVLDFSESANRANRRFFIGGSSEDFTINSLINFDVWETQVQVYDDVNKLAHFYRNGSPFDLNNSYDGTVYTTGKNYDLILSNHEGFDRYMGVRWNTVYIYRRILTPSEIAWLHREPYAMFYSESIYLWQTEAAGWTGKICGVTNPSKICGVAVADITKVCGVE